MANDRARLLRKNLTNAERILWRAISRKQLNGNRFRKQHPMGHYIVDFICLEKKLIIELDGGQHDEIHQRTHDEMRTRWLGSRGYRVVRFWNAEIYENLEGVLSEISEYLQDPRFGPPPP